MPVVKAAPVEQRAGVNTKTHLPWAMQRKGGGVRDDSKSLGPTRHAGDTQRVRLFRLNLPGFLSLTISLCLFSCLSFSLSPQAIQLYPSLLLSLYTSLSQGRDRKMDTIFLICLPLLSFLPFGLLNPCSLVTVPLFPLQPLLYLCSLSLLSASPLSGVLNTQAVL